MAGLTVNELPVTVVHEVPLFELNSYTVDPVVLVYDAVNVVELPAQIVAVPANDTVGLGTTVTDEVLEFTSEQILPASRNTARYKVVPVVLLAVIDVLVFDIVVQVVPLSVDDSQRTIFPV